MQNNSVAASSQNFFIIHLEICWYLQNYETSSLSILAKRPRKRQINLLFD
jgi:hypothetical protein